MQNKNLKRVPFPKVGRGSDHLTDENREVIKKIKQAYKSVCEATLRQYFNIGTVFIEHYKTSYRDDTVGMIAQEADMSKFTLYKAINFADEFKAEDVDLFLSGGNFVLAYKWIKAYMSLGRDAIVETFKTSSSLKEFKEKMNALKSEKKQQASTVSSDEGGSKTAMDTSQSPENPEKNSSNLSPGTKSQEQSKQDANNGDEDCKTSEAGDKDVKPEEGSGDKQSDQNPIKNTDDDPGASIDTSTEPNDGGATGNGASEKGTTTPDTTGEKHNAEKEDESGTITAGDSDKDATKNVDTGSGTDNGGDKSVNTDASPDKSKTDEMKRKTASNPLPKLNSDLTETFSQRLGKKSPTNPSPAEGIDLTKANEALKNLQKENEDLVQQVKTLTIENSELKQENQDLRQEIKDLKSSQEEDQHDYETDVSEEKEPALV